jgi:FkbM family methyltransferase
MSQKRESRFRRFKRRIAANTLYRQAKLSVKRLVGKELRILPELDCEIRQYGGWLLSPEGLQNGLVYSLGVGEDISFDLALIREFQATVHAFDPTPRSLEYLAKLNLPENFIFHPWAVTGSDCNVKLYPRIKRHGKSDDVMLTLVQDTEGEAEEAIKAPGLSFNSIMQRLAHEKIALLKMDIEGAEYEVIESILAAGHRPQQLLVEFHHRFPQIGKQKTIASLKALREAGYRVAAVSYTGYEVSFVLSA